MWQYRPVERNAKLFRAIVILGAALTAPACEGGKCPTTTCQPTDGGGPQIVDARPLDGGFIDASPNDATMVDVIVII